MTVGNTQFQAINVKLKKYCKTDNNDNNCETFALNADNGTLKCGSCNDTSYVAVHETTCTSQYFELKDSPSAHIVSDLVACQSCTEIANVTDVQNCALYKNGLCIKCKNGFDIAAFTYASVGGTT